MRKKITLLPLLCALAWLPSAQSSTEVELAAISRMGELNGIALQCSYVDQMQRIKQALVLNLPKRRELGEYFEKTTNSAFMRFMENQSTCPDALTFVDDVGSAISELESTFKK